MKRFIAQLNDGSFMNIPADRMEIREDAFILAWRGDELVGYVDIGGAINAHISEKGESSWQRSSMS